jgi:type II restriction enzyme
MLWRIANAITPNLPINFDRIFGWKLQHQVGIGSLAGSYTRILLLLPRRIESISSSTEIKKGHKHLIYCPDKPHKNAKINEAKTEIVISEIPSAEAIYESLVLPEAQNNYEIDVDLKRRHAQMQIALLMIGKQLGSRVWIAQNDKAIEYKGKKLGEMHNVIPSLK